MADPSNRGEARGGGRRLRSFADVSAALARGNEEGRAAIREAAATSSSFARVCGHSYQQLRRALGLLAVFADFATVDRVATSVLMSLRHPRLRLEEWRPSEGGWPRPTQPDDSRAAELEDDDMATADDHGAAAAALGTRDGEMAVPVIDFGKEPRDFAPTAAELPFLQAIAVPAWVFADAYGMGTNETLASSILGRMTALAGTAATCPAPATAAAGSNTSWRGDAGAVSAARGPAGIAISTGQSVGIAPAAAQGRSVARMSTGSGGDTPRPHPDGGSPVHASQRVVEEEVGEVEAVREIGPGDDHWLGMWAAARDQGLLPPAHEGTPADSTPSSNSSGGSGFGQPAVPVADLRFTAAPATADEVAALRQAIAYARDTSLQTFAALVRCGLLQLQRPASALPLPLAMAGRRAAVLAALASHDPSSIRDTKVRRDVRGAEYAPAHPGSPALSTGGHAWRSFQSSSTATTSAATSLASGSGSEPSSSSSSTGTASLGSSLVSDARGPSASWGTATGARSGAPPRSTVPRLPLDRMVVPEYLDQTDAAAAADDHTRALPADAADEDAVEPPFAVPDGAAASGGDTSVATIFSPTSGSLRRTRSGRLVPNQRPLGDAGGTGGVRQQVAGVAGAARSHRIMASVFAAAAAHATVTGGATDAAEAGTAAQSTRVRRMVAAAPAPDDSTQPPLSAIVAAACGGIFSPVPPPHGHQWVQEATASSAAVQAQPLVAGAVPLTIASGGNAGAAGGSAVRSPFFVANERVQHQHADGEEQRYLRASGSRLASRRNGFSAGAAVGNIEATAASARSSGRATPAVAALSPFGVAAGSPAADGAALPSSPGDGGIRPAFVRSHQHRRGTSDGSAVAAWASQGGAPSNGDIGTTTGAFALLLRSVPGVRHVAGAPSLHQLAALNRAAGAASANAGGSPGGTTRDTTAAAARFGGWFFAGALWSSKPTAAVESPVPVRPPVPQAPAAPATAFKRHYFGLRKPTPHRIGLPSGYDSSFLAGPPFPRNARASASGAGDTERHDHWLHRWQPLLATGVYPLTRLEHQYRRCTGCYQHFLLPLVDSPRELEHGGHGDIAGMDGMASALPVTGGSPPLMATFGASPRDGCILDVDAPDAGATPRPALHTSKLSALLYGSTVPPTPMADVNSAATCISGVRVDPFSAPHLYFDGGLSALSLPHASAAVYPGGGGGMRGDQLLLGTHACLPVTQHDMQVVIAAELPGILADCCGLGLTCAAGVSARVSDHHHHHHRGKVPPLLEALFSDAVCGGDVQATADAMVALLTDNRALHAGLRAAQLTLKLCAARGTALAESGATVIAATRAGADFTPPLTAIGGVPGGRLVIPYLMPQLQALAASGSGGGATAQPISVEQATDRSGAGGSTTTARRHTPSSGHYHRRDPTPPPSARSAGHDTGRGVDVTQLPPYALSHLPTAADASARDGFGRTLLHSLAANESWCSDTSGGAKWATMLAQAVALCDAGADPLAVDSLGHTPLHAVLMTPHAKGAGPLALIAVLAWYAFGAPVGSSDEHEHVTSAGKRLVPTGGRRSLLSLAVEHASAEALSALLQLDVALARGVIHYSRWAWQHSAAAITAPPALDYRAWADGVPAAVLPASQAGLSPHARRGDAVAGEDADGDALMTSAPAAVLPPASSDVPSTSDLRWPYADASTYLTAAFGPSVNDRSSATGTALLQVFIAYRVESLRPATAAAVWPAHRTILRCLLLAGAATETRWDVPDRGQRTALQVLLSLARHSPGAVRTAALDGMTVLLTVGGADPMAPNTIDGKTPLHEAACTRDGAAAKLLLRHAGPAALLSTSEARGRRPLQLLPVDSVRMDGYTGHVPVTRFVAMCRMGAAAGTRRRRRHMLAAYWHANRERLQAQAANAAGTAEASPPTSRPSAVPLPPLPLPAPTVAPALSTAAVSNGTGACATGAGVLSAPSSDGGRASKWIKRTFGLLPGSK